MYWREGGLPYSATCIYLIVNTYFAATGTGSETKHGRKCFLSYASGFWDLKLLELSVLEVEVSSPPMGMAEMSETALADLLLAPFLATTSDNASTCGRCLYTHYCSEHRLDFFD